MSRLIGLYSPVMGSGKTELTNVLVGTHGYVSVKFAGILKGMIRSMLIEGLGMTPYAAIDHTDGSKKEDVIPNLGVSCRHLMQTLGTDWGRNVVRADLWVHLAKLRLQRLLDGGADVVVDDMRFPNEFQAIRDLGGITVRVSRPGLEDVTGHKSEGLLEGLTFDYNLVNANGLDEWRGLASHFHEVLNRPIAVS